eukprot:symbB.v1.2.039360.t2/scaffold6506.1/size17521/1
MGDRDVSLPDGFWPLPRVCGSMPQVGMADWAAMFGHYGE